MLAQGRASLLPPQPLLLPTPAPPLTLDGHAPPPGGCHACFRQSAMSGRWLPQPPPAVPVPRLRPHQPRQPPPPVLRAPIPSAAPPVFFKAIGVWKLSARLAPPPTPFAARRANWERAPHSRPPQPAVPGGPIRGRRCRPSHHHPHRAREERMPRGRCSDPTCSARPPCANKRPIQSARGAPPRAVRGPPRLRRARPAGHPRRGRPALPRLAARAAPPALGPCSACCSCVSALRPSASLTCPARVALRRSPAMPSSFVLLAADSASRSVVKPLSFRIGVGGKGVGIYITIGMGRVTSPLGASNGPQGPSGGQRGAVRAPRTQRGAPCRGRVTRAAAAGWAQPSWGCCGC
jgi:hypothetical protein